MTKQRLRAAQRQLTELAGHLPLALAGARATRDLTRAAGAILLEGDPGRASTESTNRHRHLRDGRRADDVALVNEYLARGLARTLVRDSRRVCARWRPPDPDRVSPGKLSPSIIVHASAACTTLHVREITAS